MDDDSTASLGSLFQCLTTLTAKLDFPILNHLLAQFGAIPSFPFGCYLGAETHTHLFKTSFQVTVWSEEVSPEPPFLTIFYLYQH